MELTVGKAVEVDSEREEIRAGRELRTDFASCRVAFLIQNARGVHEGDGVPDHGQSTLTLKRSES